MVISIYWRWGYGVPETLTLLQIVRAELGVATERVGSRVLLDLSGHLGIDWACVAGCRVQ